MPTIRPRILKVRIIVANGPISRSCSAHDPTEDTESFTSRDVLQKQTLGCSAHDPTEDTERSYTALPQGSWRELQCPRSDRGY